MTRKCRKWLQAWLLMKTNIVANYAVLAIFFFFFLERRIFSNLKKCRFSLFFFLGGKCVFCFTHLVRILLNSAVHPLAKEQWQWEVAAKEMWLVCFKCDGQNATLVTVPGFSRTGSPLSNIFYRLVTRWRRDTNGFRKWYIWQARLSHVTLPG